MAKINKKINALGEPLLLSDKVDSSESKVENVVSSKTPYTSLINEEKIKNLKLKALDNMESAQSRLGSLKIADTSTIDPSLLKDDILKEYPFDKGIEQRKSEKPRESRSYKALKQAAETHKQKKNTNVIKRYDVEEELEKRATNAPETKSIVDDKVSLWSLFGLIRRRKRRNEYVDHIRALENTQLKSIETLVDRVYRQSEEKLSRLQYTIAQTHEALDALEQKAEATYAKIEPAQEEISQEAQAINDILETAKTEIKDTTDIALMSLKATGKAFEERAYTLKIVSEEGIESLRGIGKIFAHERQDFEQSFAAAEEKIQSLSLGIAESYDRMCINTQDMLKESELLKVQVHKDLSEISKETVQALCNVGNAKDELVEHAQEFRDMLRNSTAELKTLDGTIREVKDKTTIVLAKTHDLTKTISTGLKEALGQTQDIHTQIGIIDSQTDKSVRRMAKNVATLRTAMDDIGITAGDASIRLEQISSRIKSDSQILVKYSSEAVEKASDATTLLKEESSHWNVAAQNTYEQYTKLKEAQEESQRIAFLQAARFALEGLYSLSVDLARMTTGGIESDVWQAFQNGDSTAFTRLMLELSGQVSIKKAKQKFIDDTDFKDGIEKYIDQFEALYDQAESCDHNGILALSLGTSDVGRLYDFLCEIADKTSLTSSSENT